MVEGASKKEQAMLLEMGIVSDVDVLEHLPRRYEDFSLTPKEKMYSFSSGEKGVFFGRLATPVKQYRFASATKCTFYLRTSYGIDVFFVAWNRAFLSKALTLEEDYTMQGSYDEKNHCFNLLSFKKGPIEDVLLPVYSLPEDYPEHRFIHLVDLCLTRLVPEIIPAPLREKYRLGTRKEAFRLCHHPKSKEDLVAGMRYFKYEEALIFSLRNRLIKQENQSLCKTSKTKVDQQALQHFMDSLPYELTSDQKTAIEEARRDMDDPHVMNRLLQGDVGTGKTLVAATLLYANYTRGKQGALMAPTEALARQHEATLTKLYKGKLNVVLLLGSTSASERKAILSRLLNGDIDVLIGTHALFSKDVFYASLGLVIIDEQHKFGVNQRVALLGKGEESDLLLMSATPIPRTLALTLYGDMDVSTLEVFPSAKRSVKTLLLPPKDPRIKRAISWGLKEGQVYAVAPQIEDKEQPGFVSAKKLYEGFHKVYPEDTVLLHGKMKAEEKEEALASFVSGKKKILVATSVIEVGIDVPKACLLLVYEASRFSLSSLHQLRGRIGRNGHEAVCILIDSSLDEEAKQKLEILVRTDDGFELSKADLSLRGFGEMAGTRQSGLIDLKFASLLDDYKMFLYAAEDAKYIADNPKMPGHGYLIGLAKTKTVIRG